MPKYPPPEAGDRLRDISAAGLRAAFRAGEAFEEGKLGQPQKFPPAKHRTHRQNDVWVLNDTGRDLNRFDVFAVTGPIVEPKSDDITTQTFMHRRAMLAGMPNNASWRKIAVAAQWIPQDGYGLATVSGLAKCRVRIPLGAVPFIQRAAVHEGETTHLHVHAAGSAEIVWRSGGPIEGDDYWCIVLLNEEIPADWVSVRNYSGVEIPPYAVMSVVPVTLLGVRRPVSGLAAKYAVNGSTPIKLNGTGYAYFGEGPIWTKVHDNNNFALGANWGPVDGEWGIAEANSGEASFGFELLSNIISDGGDINRRVSARVFHPNELQAKWHASGRFEIHEQGIATGKFITANASWMGGMLEVGTEVVLRRQYVSGAAGYEWYAYQDARGSTGILKAKTTGGPISPGGNNTVSIWKNGVNSGETVTAWLNWMHGGEGISADKEILIQWFPDENKYVVVGAECESA